MRRRRLAILIACLCACSGKTKFEETQISQGPGGMVGNGDPITDGSFEGGPDAIPAPRVVAPPDPARPPNCDAACASFCNGLGLQNPINRGLCTALWGVGLASPAIDPVEACRRMFVDLTGRIPSDAEATATCQGDWGATAKALIADPGFVETNQQIAADTFLYSTPVVNVSRIYDMDRLVQKLFEGRVAYDQFVTVAALHPVVTRRYTTPGDIVDADFKQFLGRIPFEDERADFARLFAHWADGYIDHPMFDIRMPDAFIRFPCVNADGQIDPDRAGDCTSTLRGFNQLVLAPDIRATRDARLDEITTWSGLLSPAEWSQLQLPGRLMVQDRALWEKVATDALMQYLGYDLSQLVPQVRQELVDYFIRASGDLRALHYAVVTSVPYLMSHNGAPSSTYRWTMGPLKQMRAEVWLDGLARATGVPMAACDRRITDPDALLQSGSLAAYQLVDASRWGFNAEGEVDHSYSDVARNLGGCPDNISGGRFSVISVLTTVTQLSFVNRVCNPSFDSSLDSSSIDLLLPAGMSPSLAVTGPIAGQIADFQYRTLMGHAPTPAELTDATTAGAECALTAGCTAEKFARPLCFALLSSADVLFY